MTQPNTQATPDSPLLAFVLAALTAMLAPTLTDIGLAQRAAREAVAAHQARGETDWFAIGQIAGFGLTVLDSLRMSMAEDTSPPMKLKLRANANAANRAAGTIADRLASNRRTSATPEPVDSEPPGPQRSRARAGRAECSTRHHDFRRKRPMCRPNSARPTHYGSTC